MELLEDYFFQTKRFPSMLKKMIVMSGLVSPVQVQERFINQVNKLSHAVCLS